MTVLLFLGTIVVLVGIHELGHFIAARLFNVYIFEYAIGMGPKLYSFQARETRYSIRLIPIGGYVRMAGEDRTESSDQIPAQRVLYNKPPYVRALISLAGPLCNLLLAFIVSLIVIWSTSVPVLQVAEVIPGTPAASVLQPGDRILEMDGTPIFTLDQITSIIQRSAGAPIEIELRRDGTATSVTLQPEFEADVERYQVGAYFVAISLTNELAEVPASSPLYNAGLRTGDRITSVDGTSVNTAVGILLALEQVFSEHAQAILTVSREGETFERSLEKGDSTADGLLATVRFADLGMEGHRPGFAMGLSLAAEQFALYVRLLGETVRELFGGSLAARDAVTGPVGIARLLGEGFSMGASVFFQLLAFLSLNFGLINLIPFPALDGSRVVFALYEWVRGKPIPPEREGIIHAIGFLILIALMILITYQDIARLFG